RVPLDVSADPRRIGSAGHGVRILLRARRVVPPVTLRVYAAELVTSLLQPACLQSGRRHRTRLALPLLANLRTLRQSRIATAALPQARGNRGGTGLLTK